MVRMRYVGIHDPKAEFEALRPYHKALHALRLRVKPFGPDYHILSAAICALEAAAVYFTEDRLFYGIDNAPSGEGRGGT